MESMAVFSIARFALLSRFAVILIQIAANAVIPDHGAGVFNPPVTDAQDFNAVDNAIHFVLGGFRRWDALYFLHIAQHGYTYENCAAFFPMFPIMISASKGVAGFFPFVSESSLLLVFAVTLNVVYFVTAALLLFCLGQEVTKDDRLAYYSTILFCINPASIFMTAPYAESLFACLSLGGMLCVQQGKLFTGSLLIGSSALARSNGLVSIGFILHLCAAEYLAKLAVVYRARFSREYRLVTNILQTTIQYALRSILLVVSSVIPFAIYQFFIYKKFCFPGSKRWARSPMNSALVDYGHEKGYKLPWQEPVSAWCHSTLPLSYSYIQSKHWNVGFMAYYELKQIPNFVLAAPIIILSYCACYSYYCKQPSACRTLGLVKTEKVKVETIGSHAEEGEKSGWRNADLVVYMLHLLFLTTFGCFFMHIQVLTRFLCSTSPLIYWFAAYVVVQSPSLKKSSDPDFSEEISLSDLCNLYQKSSTEARCVLLFFAGYFVIGIVAFSNFLPWT